MRNAVPIPVWLMRGGGREADREDRNYWFPNPSPTPPGPGIPRELLEGEEYRVELEGTVRVDPVSGDIGFDFPDFGEIVKDAKYQSFLVGIGFWPTQRESVEIPIHFSNDVWIEVVR